MPNTFTLIASSTVGSGGAASIDFTSIPNTYTDLVVKISTRSNRSGAPIDETYMRLNGNTGNFSNTYLQGNGSAANSGSGSYPLWLGYSTAATATANTFSNSEILISNYTSSNNKSLSIDAVQEDNSSTAYATLHANLWNVSSAVTSITFYPLLGSKFDQYSTAYLYGVKNA
jgi:hypothetical protein